MSYFYVLLYNVAMLLTQSCCYANVPGYQLPLAHFSLNQKQVFVQTFLTMFLLYLP